MADIAWAATADVMVDHSGIDTPGLHELQKPIVYVSHGRPASSFIGERAGRAPVLSYWYRRNTDPRYKAVVTFWPEHVPYLEGIWTKTPVHAVYPPVDLSAWRPGPTSYDFAGNRGSVNVVIADMWRDDVDPFPCLAAFRMFAQSTPGARLHLYGLPAERRGIDVYLRIFRDAGQLGVIQGWTKGLLQVYRAADLVISPHRIYTRTLREAMAVGCQVVSGRDADPTDLRAFSEAMVERLAHRRDERAVAAVLFDARESARQFLEVAA